MFSFGSRARGLKKASSAATFDPATLNLSGWWRADYSAAPWVGNASAGSSGGRDLVTASVDPTAGTAQNGKVPASFNGTSSLLVTSTAMSDYVSAGAGTIYALVYMPTAAADAGIGTNPGLLGEGAGNLAIGYSDAGLEAAVYDGATKTVEVAASAAAYHFLEMSWDGVNLSLAIDSGARSSTACGNVFALGAAMNVGRNLMSGAYLEMRVLELMTSTVQLSNADRANVRTYANARYALSV
jgi:hypothetical protein